MTCVYLFRYPVALVALLACLAGDGNVSASTRMSGPFPVPTKTYTLTKVSPLPIQLSYRHPIHHQKPKVTLPGQHLLKPIFKRHFSNGPVVGQTSTTLSNPISNPIQMLTTPLSDNKIVHKNRYSKSGPPKPFGTQPNSIIVPPTSAILIFPMVFQNLQLTPNLIPILLVPKIQFAPVPIPTRFFTSTTITYNPPRHFRSTTFIPSRKL